MILKGTPLKLESMERLPLRHLWRYHIRWWTYACSDDVHPKEKLNAFAEAHRAAKAAAKRTEYYLE